MKFFSEKADLLNVLNSEEQKNLDADKFSKLLEILLPVAPRLYSISSSKEAHDEVHLTVNLHKFNTNDQEKEGFVFVIWQISFGRRNLNLHS